MKTKKYSVINYGIAQGDPYFIDQKSLADSLAI